MDRSVRQYVRKLELALAQRSEGPRVFTQKDYRLATRWHGEGIPIGLIREILGRRRVAARSLVQVAATVEESWKTVRAGRLREEDETRSVAGPVAAGVEEELENALGGAPEGSELQELLRSLLEQFRAGVSPEGLERQLEEQLPGAVSPEQRQAAEEATRLTLERHRGRMPPEAFRETVRKGVLARLRRSAGIPRLR